MIVVADSAGAAGSGSSCLGGRTTRATSVNLARRRKTALKGESDSVFCCGMAASGDEAGGVSGGGWTGVEAAGVSAGAVSGGAAVETGLAVEDSISDAGAESIEDGSEFVTAGSVVTGGSEAVSLAARTAPVFVESSGVSIFCVALFAFSVGPASATVTVAGLSGAEAGVSGKDEVRGGSRTTSVFAGSLTADLEYFGAAFRAGSAGPGRFLALKKISGHRIVVEAYVQFQKEIKEFGRLRGQPNARCRKVPMDRKQEAVQKQGRL